MAPGADLTVSSPPARIPKLKYRNPLPAGETLPSLDERRHPVSQPCDSDEPPPTPSSTAPSSYRRPSFDAASLTSASVASTTSSAASSNDSWSSKKKKKKGSVFGFLSLKEPSQLAFEQYAEAQRKQALEKGSPSPTGRPASTYASKKLPGNVPKVNSKWDGVPDSIKNRHSKSSSSSTKSTKNRHSVMSQDSQKTQLTALPQNASKVSVMTDGTRNPPNSVASLAGSVSSQAPSPSPSDNDLPEISYYFPEQIDDGASATQPEQPLTYHPATIDSPPRSAEPTFDFSSPDQVPGLGPGSQPPQSLAYERAIIDSSPRSLQPAFDFSSPDQVPGLRSVSPASSTSSGDTIVRDTADIIFNRLNEQPQQNFWGDAPAVQPHDDSGAATVPESHDFLFDDILPANSPKPGSPMTTPPIPHYAPTRPVQNFSRPIQLGDLSSPPRSSKATSYRTTPVSSGLPTLYEASVNSTESDESDDTVQDDADADAQSIAPSTIAPSVMSARWHDSPRERLGLGGRLRMDAALPWADSSGDVPAARCCPHIPTRNATRVDG